MKGPLKKLEKDDSSEAEEIDGELKRHIAVDSEDERNTRHYQVSTNIGLSNKKLGNAFDQEDEDADSQIEFEFMLGDRRSVTIEKKNLAAIVKIQSRIRYFLFKLRQKAKQKIIYQKILKREDNLVRFTLIKDPSMYYKLMADVQLKRNMKSSASLTYLPFEDEDASLYFEKCLRFTIE